MARIIRWFMSFAITCLLIVGIAYFAVFPTLGRTMHKVNFNEVSGDAARGEYVSRMSGCVACHTDIKNNGELFAGGPPLVTPFGTFYAPNITSSKEHGLGVWSLESFFHALTAGLSPEGDHYYPTFPYTSYTELRLQDIADLKAYLETVPPIAKPSRPHEVSWPWTNRRLVGAWKTLEFSVTPFTPDKSKSDAWNRGAYLVEGPGHCAQCHSRRNIIGGLGKGELTGNLNGPNGDPVPALSGAAAKLAKWTREDFVFYLQTGMTADGDVSGGAMVEVIEESTRHMTESDLNAIADYLGSL